MLTYFTEDDHAPLTQLQVRAICDLRRAEEREREPTRWPHGNVNALSWDDGIVTPTVRGLAADRPKNAAGMLDAMIALYRALPEWMGPRIGGMFSAIAMDGDVPLIVHCAAGKDRTGIAVAVLLRPLGVPEETAIQDYLLTNSSGNFEEFIRSRTRRRSSRCHRFAQPVVVDAGGHAARFLRRRTRRFCTEAIKQIGDVEAYLVKTAGVSPRCSGEGARGTAGVTTSRLSSSCRRPCLLVMFFHAKMAGLRRA